MKKLLVLLLLASTAVYFAPTANAQAVLVRGHHRHHKHHKHHHRHHHHHHRHVVIIEK